MTSRLSTRPLADGREAAGVLLPLPLDAPYDYVVPSGAEVAPGSVVKVPLGGRVVAGVVWGPAQGDVEAGKLREIISLHDIPPLPKASLEFVDWVAAYTLSKRGSVLRMVMRAPGALTPPKPATAFELAPGVAAEDDSLPFGLRPTAARRQVIRVLSGRAPMTAAALARTAGVSPSVIRGLAEAGALRRAEVDDSLAKPDPHRPGPDLSPAQRTAADDLVRRVADSGFSVTVLDGVTGSGKTEVYFEAVAAALAAGRQVAVLLPEIALTADWLARFETRFGAPPAVWHSDLLPAQRRRAWRDVLTGDARLAVGARSALMLPFPDLGLIVVDEEHDPGFKQDEGVIYNARDMAVVRGRIGGFPVVLASATPSLETMDNVWRRRYERISLPERFAGAQLPEISSVDMRDQAMDRRTWLSPALVEAARNALAGERQAMLFLNRRGYAPLTLCRACGHRLECPHCTAWLVEHRLLERLQCHHCGYQATLPRICPSCEAEDRFAACGPGVERLAEEARRRFPEARLEIMSSDTVRRPGEAAALVKRMHAREIDLLIGTQIMAKGFHFPALTLVGVVDADLGLSGGDLRAAERTHQLLNQVAGRAGRGETPGQVLLQTWQPEHAVMRALESGDGRRFMEAEAASRRRHGMPPYGRLAAVIVSGTVEEEVDATASRLGRAAPRSACVSVLGPAPAPMAVIRGRHRRRLLMAAPRDVKLQDMVRRWIAGIRPGTGVRVAVDIDPYSFM